MAVNEVDELTARTFGAVGLPMVTDHRVAKRTVTDHDIRCQGKVDDRLTVGEKRTCNKKLAEFAGRPWKLVCPRCKTANVSPE